MNRQYTLVFDVFLVILSLSHMVSWVLDCVDSGSLPSPFFMRFNFDTITITWVIFGDVCTNKKVNHCLDQIYFALVFSCVFV